MSAEAITTPILPRPRYDNTRVNNFGLWVCDNARVLARFATQLGFDVAVPDDELAHWIHCQHDVEILTSTADPLGGDNADGSKTAVETVRVSSLSSKLPHGDTL
jgi:hypothetical protein